MIGIGLGGFMEGLQGGMKTRADMDDRKRQKVLDERQDKAFERQQKMWDRDDAEYERQEADRTAIRDINTQAKAEFDKQVAAGTQQPDNFENFWSTYALPKMKNTYLATGDLESAEKVIKWGETADAKRGGKLAMNALLKAQTGDPDGALADVIEAGQIKGYIDHGYELQGNDKIMSPDGQHVGYRLKLTTPDGDLVEQDITVADLPKMIATFANPEAAWQSQLAAQQKAAEDAKEIETYKTKKQIDKEYGTGSSATRTKAIEALRKRMDGGLAGDETKFDDLPREEQEKLISDELALQEGQPGLSGGSPSPAAPSGSGRKVVVDTATGKPVVRGGEKPAEKPKGEKTSEKSSRGESREERVAYMLEEADVAVRNGSRPTLVAEGLLMDGIPEKDWPESLKTALKKERATQMPGLGG